MAAVNIFNAESDTLLSGTSGNDTIENGDGAYNVTVNAGAGDDSVKNFGDSVLISVGAGNDTVVNHGLGNFESGLEDWGGDNVTVFGGAGDDYISNVGDEDIEDDPEYTTAGDNIIIDGGEGNDTIENSGYKATISGGAGKDYISLDDAGSNIIQYASGDGNDTVIGFNSDDTLQITEGSYTTVKSGDDLIVKVGDGSITLKNVSTAKIQGKSDNLPTGLSYNSDKTKITASKKFTQKSFSFAKYPEVQFFDGQKITNNVKITGNSLDNTIEGGKKTDTIYGGKGNDRVFGNGGNDKLYGGAGNDTLYGGNGNDVFSYSSGDNVITDYTEKEDYIRLYKCSITGSSVKGKNVILKTTTGNITIKNGKGKEISVLTTQVYGNSTSKLFAEDNFMTADNISEIVAEKSVGEFEFNSSEKLTQENLITFADK